ncbi:MAG: 4Fe-4S dicluster domain-containing protein [Duodenibacillus sp.]|nr:4Fe-4S dicluster domain-containing protein [Duodenibacillus sp.]
MKKWDRRDVLLGGSAVAVAGACGFSISMLARRSEAKGLLRPPGALEEKAFLASCIKCGQCIQVCPYHALNLLDLTSGIDMGTPMIDPRRRGCYLCDLFPCVLCCPSGALDSRVQSIDQVRMGTAYVNKPDRCWARDGRAVPEDWIETLIGHGNATELEKGLNVRLRRQMGTSCRLCVEVCPVPERDGAIRLVDGKPEIGSKCVGCGACVEVCPDNLIEVRVRQSYEDVYAKDKS